MTIDEIKKAGAVASAVLLLSFAAACSSNGGGSGGSTGATGAGVGGSDCALYVVPAGTNLMSPTVMFKADVMQVFNDNCSLSTCHGAVAPNIPLFLGATSAMGSDAAEVYTNLVGPKSTELTSMPYVTKGDPEQSYLMHKLDGDRCHFDAQCVGGTCLAAMPNGATPLPVSTRDTVRRWIAQGANND